MSLLKRIKEVGGALTLTAAMAAGSPEKAEAHHPYYYPGPVVSRTVIGPFGGVWTRTFVPGPVWAHGPVWTPAPVYVQPQFFVQPVPVYVQPAPIYVYPQTFCW